MSRISGAPRASRGAHGSSAGSEGTKGSRYRKVCGLLISAGACVVALGAACTDKDNTAIDSPDSGVSNGGSGGSSGTGGTGANGGSAGTASAGASGTGGDEPDASAGASGSGGSSGSAGNDAGTDAGLVDGGVNADAGDAAPALTSHQIVSAAICARLDEVDNCPAPDSTCINDQVFGWEGLQATYTYCVGTIEEYFNCIGSEPVTSYDCSTASDPNAPEITVPNPGNCQAEEAAFYNAFSYDPTDPAGCTH